MNIVVTKSEYKNLTRPLSKNDLFLQDVQALGCVPTRWDDASIPAQDGCTRCAHPPTPQSRVKEIFLWMKAHFHGRFKFMKVWLWVTLSSTRETYLQVRDLPFCVLLRHSRLSLVPLKIVQNPKYRRSNRLSHKGVDFLYLNGKIVTALSWTSQLVVLHEIKHVVLAIWSLIFDSLSLS